MKRLAFLLLFLISLSAPAFGQTSSPTQVAKKFNGEATAFSWDYDTAEESFATHFSLRWVDDLTKTTIELKKVPITARSTSVSASFTPGFKLTYYNLVAVRVEVLVNVDSTPSNTVATERIGKPPSNFRF